VPSGRSQGRSVLDALMMEKRVLIHEVSLIQTCLQLANDYSRGGLAVAWVELWRSETQGPNLRCGQSQISLALNSGYVAQSGGAQETRSTSKLRVQPRSND
jgi:hypothetical protein